MSNSPLNCGSKVRIFPGVNLILKLINNFFILKTKENDILDILATKVHEEVKKKATISKNRKIVIEHMNVGQYIRQGDLYIRKIEKITGIEKIENRQLAPGMTKGSRHIVDESVELFKVSNFDINNVPQFIIGPQIKAKQNFKITHPEHADFYLPFGNYQVSYQCDWSRQERVRD